MLHLVRIELDNFGVANGRTIYQPEKFGHEWAMSWDSLPNPKDHLSDWRISFSKNIKVQKKITNSTVQSAPQLPKAFVRCTSYFSV